MERIVNFDVAAAIILIIILFSNLFTKLNHNTLSKNFILLVVIDLIAAVFNVTSAALENLNVTDDRILYLTKTIYVLMHNLATPVFVMYLISLTRTWPAYKKHPVLSFGLLLPFTASAAIILSNPVTGLLFTYENGVFTSSGMQFILYLIAGVYLLYGLIHFFRRCEFLSVKEMLVVITTILLMVVAIVLRDIFPTSLVDIFANAVGVLLMSVTIQNPEMSVDPVTHLRKYDAYVNDIKKDLGNKNIEKIIFINIANFDSLQRLLGFEAMNQLLLEIAIGLNRLNYENKTRAEIYYLDRGRFRIVINSYCVKKADGLAEIINHSLKYPMTINQIEAIPDAFVCIAECPTDIKDFKTLMAFGTDFHTKVEKTGEVYVAAELFKHRNFHLLNEIDAIIEKAFKKNHFRVYYQPIYSVEKKRYVSAEALLRLMDEEYGFVPPKLFIPAAERSGAIHRIGEFVFKDVCRFISDEKFATLGLDYIQINLSTVQCMQRGLADNIISMLNKYKIEPSKINFEITETTADYNQAILVENMMKLSNYGIHFSLDDFGASYSNVSKVSMLPFHTVKLDKTLIDSGLENKDFLFIENTIKMLKNMNLKVVAEGVETEQMVDVFSKLDCDFIQGFFYSKPIPEGDFIEFIRSSKNK